MTHLPMSGVRVLEVAQFTYVPSAGAVLADWGADVIKVEHAFTGDAQRGMVGIGPAGYVEGSFSPLMDHPNRGKRSVGLALEHPAALEVLYRMAERSDVFLTNFLPAARVRLRIDVDDIRAVNPSIIYARGSAHGHRGPDAERGGFDAATYLARAGKRRRGDPTVDRQAVEHAGPGLRRHPGRAHPGRRDLGRAVRARTNTGEGSVVDVSLLSMGAYATALSLDISLMSNEPWEWPPQTEPGAPINPVAGYFETSDGRWIYLALLQAGRYWADFCRHIDRPDLIDDERFNTAEKIIANAPEGGRIVRDEIIKRTFAEWIERFATLEGQWTIVQDSVQVAHDEQLRGARLLRAGHRRRRQRTRVDDEPGAVRRHPRHDDAWPAVRRAHRRHPPRSRPQRRRDPPAQDRRRGNMISTTLPHRPDFPATRST